MLRRGSTAVSVSGRGSVSVAVLAIVLTLGVTGCSPEHESHGERGGSSSSPMPSSATASPRHSAPPPHSTPTSTNPNSPGPAQSSTPSDEATALAVKACEAILPGLSADRVAVATPLAVQAAAIDSTWAPLATRLTFVRDHPIDPNTGQGPQQTIDDSHAAADDCFTLAHVPVAND